MSNAWQLPAVRVDAELNLVCPSWEDDKFAWDEFMLAVVASLVDKDYAVAQLPLSPDDRESAVDQVYDMAEWQLLKAEFEVAYMGLDNRDKHALLPMDDLDAEPANVLERCDRLISLLGLHFAEPLIEDEVGFSSWGRLNGMVRIPWAGDSDKRRLRPPALCDEDYEDGKVVGHLNFLERRAVMILLSIDTGGGEVCLFPLGGSEVDGRRIPLRSGKSTMLVFRHDRLGYSYRPSGFSIALQSWLLCDPPCPDATEKGVVSLPLPLHGERASIMALANRYPGDAFGPTFLWSFLFGGGDGLIKVPIMRWDMESYYDPDRGTGGSSYAKHGGFCSDESIVTFDNSFFRIPEEEASVMSPGQRVVLETGFEVLHQAGFTRDSSHGFRCGVFLGDSGNDWPYMREAQNALRMLSQSNYVTGSRLSHCLGLNGPVSTTDTACSSSLVAIGLAHASLRRTSADQRKASVGADVEHAVAIGSGLLLSPRMYILYCGPGMLSPRGRCFTYDSSADGYARGEGCGALFLEWSDKDEVADEMLACLVGSAINQDGRSASMTAPSGPAQQMCIKASMAEARLAASEIAVAECHGTGTALGDPIEVSALRAVMEDRKHPILNTSAKSNIGHLEAAAGMAGVIKCVTMLASSAGTPNVHLKYMNPHMDVVGYPAFFETEASDTFASSGISGVSSFGFGGTNARGDLWARCRRGARATEEVCTAKWLEERSMHYQRLFHYGTPGPHVNDRLYVTGTWDAFATVLEMEMRGPGVFVALLLVGETCREQFRMLINRDPGQAIHPDRLCAGPEADARGPDAAGKDKTWLIDGRADGVKPWTIYEVRFQWRFTWDVGELRSVTWRPTNQVAPVAARSALHKHTYSIVGTWSSWQFQGMMRLPAQEETLWTTTVRIGFSGREEFQFVRDNDWSQCIYPAVPRARKTSIPVRGPDEGGAGKCWLLTGSAGDLVRIQLRVVAGELTVSAFSEATGTNQTWESTEKEEWRQYFITGTWNGWRFSPMFMDQEHPGVHRFLVELGPFGVEEFRLAAEQDPTLQLYPDCESAGLGEGVLCGPDAGGARDGLSWRISGEPGARYQITLDMNEQDRLHALTWVEVMPVRTLAE